MTLRPKAASVNAIGAINSKHSAISKIADKGMYIYAIIDLRSLGWVVLIASINTALH